MSDQSTQAQPMESFADLMSLAQMDTSDLQAQVTRLARQGIYVVELGKPGFTEQPPQDPADPMSFTLAYPSTILAFTALEPSADDNELVGKPLNDRYFVWGKDVKQAIQLLMGRAKVAGFRYKGKMGGVEGAEPGWLDEQAGKRVAVRVTWYTPKGGDERARFDWLSVKQLEKLQIPWEIMGRDFLDEHGQPQEPGFYDKKKAA